MKTEDAPQTSLLERHYRRVRHILLIWSAGSVFVAAAMIAAARLGWMRGLEVWATAPAVLSAVLLAWWFRRASRLTPTTFAREMDARWSLRARLEAADELANDQSALARAQRADTAERVVGRAPVGAAAWLTGMAVVTLAISLLAVEGSVLAVRAIRAKPAASAKSDKTSAAAATPEGNASIAWLTPEREIKATAIEEVPLTAMVESLKGFRRLALEVFVNGKHQLTRPLEAVAAGGSMEGGAHEVTPSLYLDETGAKPFEIVSYHLVGELVDGTPGKVVTSPLQFIQIRPPQRDVAKLGKANPDAIRLLAMLSALKYGQLQLIDANFALTHLADVKAGATWQAENTRVEEDQTQLVKMLDEARAFGSKMGAPSLIVGNLDEARGAMNEAVSAIKAGRNADAAEPQGRAIALITACEKLFNEALNVTGEMPPVSMLDPFGDAQVFKLEPRADTPAGRVESLVTRQGSMIRRMNAQSKTGAAGDGGLGGEEAGIAHDADELAKSGQLDEGVQRSVAAAATAASAARSQLAAADLAAAREPAGNALATLQHAVEVQERAGRAVAAAELVRVRSVLNAASRSSQADRAAKLSGIRAELRAAAVQQQRTGSAEAAAQLLAFADSLIVPKMPGSLSGPNSPERAHDAAIAAARVQIALGAQVSATKRAVRLLNRATGTGADARTPQALADVELASQEAEWLTSAPALSQDARTLGDRAGELQRSSAGLNEAAWQALAKAAAKIAAALDLAQSVGTRDEIVKRFNPDDIDPAYREAVEAYFEKLSREGAEGARPPAAVKP